MLTKHNKNENKVQKNEPFLFKFLLVYHFPIAILWNTMIVRKFKSKNYENIMLFVLCDIINKICTNVEQNANLIIPIM